MTGQTLLLVGVAGGRVVGCVRCVRHRLEAFDGSVILAFGRVEGNGQGRPAGAGIGARDDRGGRQ